MRRWGRGARGWLLEAAIVAVLLVSLGGVGAAWWGQHRHDDQAASIARWMHVHHVERVAWPVSLRSSVPELLSAGVTPVLVEPDAPPAQYAVVATPAVVTTRPPPRGLPSTQNVRFGDLTLHVVDLAKAARIPVTDDQHLAVQYSRPYRFTPLRPSLKLLPQRPLRVRLVLAPGRHDLTFEAFDPTHKSGLVVNVEGLGVARTEHFALLGLVDAPQRVSFVVPGSRPRPVTFTAAPDPSPRAGPRPVVLLHAWALGDETVP